MTLDLVIKNGTIVTAETTYQADVGIRGERIALIGEDLTGEREIDASGKLVIPGGVDVHVHFSLDLGNGVDLFGRFLHRHARGSPGRHDDRHRLRAS